MCGPLDGKTLHWKLLVCLVAELLVKLTFTIHAFQIHNNKGTVIGQYHRLDQYSGLLSKGSSVKGWMSMQFNSLQNYSSR